MKHKAMKLAMASALVFPTAVTITNESAEAATTTQVSSAVQKAISTSQVLRRACSIEWNGDGKTRPYNEYNAAKKAYNEALKKVNTLKGDQKEIYLAKLDEPQLQIKRAAHYIDAITAGLKIEEKKEYLQSHVQKGELTAETVKAYHELSFEIKKQAALLDRVYGVTTREAIRENYKKTAERLRDELSYPITVKMALTEIETLPASNEEQLVTQAKKVLYFLEAIPQKSYYKQLSTEWNNLKDKVPTTSNDTEYTSLLEINDSLTELNTLIKPGISDSKVPALYDSITSQINKVENTLSKEKLSAKLKEIMDQLTLPIAELKGLLTKSAIEAGIPPEIVKSIVFTENGSLQQFDSRGEVFKSPDNGFGLMQVTPLDEHDQRFDWEQVKYDLNYNVEIGLKILQEKWDYQGKRIPVINNGEKDILENWYFAVMAYNGLSKTNDPNYSAKPYQLKVYNSMGEYAQVKPEILSKEDLVIGYNSTTGQALFDGKMSYQTDKKTKSTQLHKTGDIVTLANNANFRDKPSTNGARTVLSSGSNVTILEGPIEDDNKFNLFVWYKVKVNSTGQIGYLASVSL